MELPQLVPNSQWIPISSPLEFVDDSYMQCWAVFSWMFYAINIARSENLLLAENPTISSNNRCHTMSLLLWCEDTYQNFQWATWWHSGLNSRGMYYRQEIFSLVLNTQNVVLDAFPFDECI
jgi:hypothetical protein